MYILLLLDCIHHRITRNIKYIILIEKQWTGCLSLQLQGIQVRWLSQEEPSLNSSEVNGGA